MTTIKKFLQPVIVTATVLSPFSPPQPAQALTNMRDASYFNSWVDLDQTRYHESFTLERVYDSRSRHIGGFGFGWCTRFESRLQKLGDGRITLFECGRSEELVYEKDRGAYTAVNRAGDRLVPASDGHLIRASDGRLEDFDASGRLIGITDRSGRRLSLSYDRQMRLYEIAAPQGAAIRFWYAKDPSRVARVETLGLVPPGDISYEYEAFDLVRVQPSAAVRTRGPYSYTYDRFHNLESIRQGNRLLESITYDSELDRVTSVATSDGCRESYQFSSPSSPDRFTAEAYRVCADSRTPPARVHFEFWYRRGSGSLGSSLTRMRTESDHGITEVAFDPVNGHVTDVKRSRALTLQAKGGS